MSRSDRCFLLGGVGLLVLVPVLSTPSVAQQDATSRVLPLEIVYFVPKDRTPTQDYKTHIERILDAVNAFFRKEMKRHGVPFVGLNYRVDQGEPRLVVVNGDHPAAHYAENPSNTIYREIYPRLGTMDEHLFVVFAEVRDERIPASQIYRGVAMARGGMATIPTSRFAEGPGVAGFVAHELGHAFGLPHSGSDRARDIMVTGSDLFAKFPLKDAIARAEYASEAVPILRWSGYIAPDTDRTNRWMPKAKVTGPKRLPAGTREVRITVEAEDEKELGGACVLVINGEDPVAHDRILSGRLLEGSLAKWEETVVFPPLKRASYTQIEVRVMDRGGNRCVAALPIEVQ